MADTHFLSKMPQIRQRFINAINVKVVSDKTSSAFQFRLPGFKYDDFNQAGHLSVVRLNRMMEMAEFLPGSGFELPESSTLSYLLASYLVINSKSLYHNAALTLPMLYDYRKIRTGRTSVDVCERLYAEEEFLEKEKFINVTNQQPLITRILRVVMVNENTKRPIELPEHIRNSISTLTTDDTQLPVINIPTETPSEAARHTVTVRYEDLDNNYHVNQGNYLRYALESATVAALAGKYRDCVVLTGDLRARDVRSVSGLYTAECRVSDQLTVSSWQDPVDSCSLFFIISNNDKLAYRAKFTFFADSDSRHKL